MSKALWWMGVLAVMAAIQPLWVMFAGSGTHGVAALRLGRRFVGCEVQRHYYELARGRLEAEARMIKALLGGYQIQLNALSRELSRRQAEWDAARGLK